jgi:hypothetical protein
MEQPGPIARGQGLSEAAFLSRRKMTGILDPDGQLDEMKRIGDHAPMVACQAGFSQPLFHMVDRVASAFRGRHRLTDHRESLQPVYRFADSTGAEGLQNRFVKNTHLVVVLGDQDIQAAQPLQQFNSQPPLADTVFSTQLD